MADEPSIVLPPAGYDLGELIGKGGMGEVVAARDRKIGRDIAIKRIHGAPGPRAIARFLREARVQARLQHPAIVPVHDLGTDGLGRFYFTMKRLSGVTLAQRIAENHPVQPLLRAFVEVLLAMEFAHSRRVIHRDLKPANIMLGEFGEVYVIDWGLARELEQPGDDAADAPDEPIDEVSTASATRDRTSTADAMSPLEREPAGSISPSVVASTAAAGGFAAGSSKDDGHSDTDAATLGDVPSRRSRPSSMPFAAPLAKSTPGESEAAASDRPSSASTGSDQPSSSPGVATVSDKPDASPGLGVGASSSPSSSFGSGFVAVSEQSAASSGPGAVSGTSSSDVSSSSFGSGFGALGDKPAASSLAATSAGERTIPTASSSLATRVGAVLGTPGYMAPEQVRGESVTSAADIYALGAILFELLTGTPLHPPGEEAMMSTLTAQPRSPAEAAPDRGIAPELDALCLAAQAEDPAKRPTAHAMGDRLRRYVDGDRDLERRRTLAAEQLDAANTALASDDPSARAIALRHAGRAIALDPESTAAADLVGRLVLERPTVLPPALVKSLDELDRAALRRRSRRAALSYGTVLLSLGIVPVLEVRSWPWLVACYALLTALIAFAARGAVTGTVSPYFSMVGNCLLTIAWTRFASPFILAPAMICGALIAVSSHPWNQERPWTIFAWAGFTVTTPFVLEATGVFDSTWSIHDGTLRLVSDVFNIRGTFDITSLIVANLIFILLVGAFAYTITRTGRQASRDLHIQAWHLRHLIDR